MNIIDENIVFSQRQRLTELKIHYKQIGFEIGRLGMKDLNDVIPLLHHLKLGRLVLQARLEHHKS